MDWSRAKTILIVFLFAVNIFLFGTYMKKESDDRKASLELRSDVVAVLGRQGIIIAEESIPYDQVDMNAATIRLFEDNAALASSLLGEVTETENAENTVYSSASGNIMFSSDSFSFACEANREVNTPDEAMNIAKDIASKLKISYSGGEITVNATAGGYKAKIPQIFNGVKILRGDIELNISTTGNILGSGKFIGSGNLAETESKTMSVSALLFEFADSVSELEKERIEITKLDYGYTARTPAGGRVFLVPTLEVSTDAGVFYIDMSDGTMVEA